MVFLLTNKKIILVNFLSLDHKNIDAKRKKCNVQIWKSLTIGNRRNEKKSIEVKRERKYKNVTAMKKGALEEK